MSTQNSDKICFPSLAGNRKNERDHAKYRQNLPGESVITINSNKTWGRVFPYGRASATKWLFFTYLFDFVCIFTVCSARHFLCTGTVFLNTGALAPRTPYFWLFCSKKHTPPHRWLAAGWWVGWVVAGWLVAGCWLLGMDHWFRYIYIYIYKPHERWMMPYVTNI